MFSHAKDGELRQNNMLLARVFLYTLCHFLYMSTSKSAGLRCTPNNNQRVLFNLLGRPLPFFTVIAAPTATSACTDSTGPGSAILRDLPRLSCGWAGFPGLASTAMLLEAGTSLKVTLVSAVEVVTLTFLGAGAVGRSMLLGFRFFPVVDGVDSRVVASVTPFFSFGRGLDRPVEAVTVADASVASSKLGSVLFLRLVGLGAVPPPTISLVWMSSVTAVVDFLSVAGAPVLDPSCESTVSRELCSVGESSGAGAFFFPLARAFGFGRGFETAFGTEGIKTSVSTPIFSGKVAVCWSTSWERFKREGPATGRISWVGTADTAPGVELDDLLSSLFSLS
jgi:hypothetical protein